MGVGRPMFIGPRAHAQGNGPSLAVRPVDLKIPPFLSHRRFTTNWKIQVGPTESSPGIQPSWKTLLSIMRAVTRMRIVSFTHLENESV
jgi:hypothetical protein